MAPHGGRQQRPRYWEGHALDVMGGRSMAWRCGGSGAWLVRSALRQQWRMVPHALGCAAQRSAPRPQPRQHRSAPPVPCDSRAIWVVQPRRVVFSMQAKQAACWAALRRASRQVVMGGVCAGSASSLYSSRRAGVQLRPGQKGGGGRGDWGGGELPREPLEEQAGCAAERARGPKGHVLGRAEKGAAWWGNRTAVQRSSHAALVPNLGVLAGGLPVGEGRRSSGGRDAHACRHGRGAVGLGGEPRPGRSPCRGADQHQKKSKAIRRSHGCWRSGLGRDTSAGSPCTGNREWQ